MNWTTVRMGLKIIKQKQDELTQVNSLLTQSEEVSPNINQLNSLQVQF